jgi:hypothetical protein
MEVGEQRTDARGPKDVPIYLSPLPFHSCPPAHYFVSQALLLFNPVLERGKTLSLQ